MEELDCALIGVCAVIRSNTVCIFGAHSDTEGSDLPESVGGIAALPWEASVSKLILLIF